MDHEKEQLVQRITAVLTKIKITRLTSSAQFCITIYFYEYLIIIIVFSFMLSAVNLLSEYE